MAAGSSVFIHMPRGHLPWSHNTHTCSHQISSGLYLCLLLCAHIKQNVILRAYMTMHSSLSHTHTHAHTHTHTLHIHTHTLHIHTHTHCTYTVAIRSLRNGIFTKTLCMTSSQFLSIHYNLHSLYGLTEANATMR